MTFASTAEILRFAIEREEEAALSYGDLARDAADPIVKGLLLEFQSEEKNHKRLLENISDGKAVTFTDREIPDLKISDSLIEEPIGPDSGFQNLLIHAARKEEKAIELYTGLRDAVSDPEFRRLLAFLIQQEKGHKLRLEQEYERQILQED
jgi:rubrerythrin